MSANENGERCCDAACPCQEKIRSLEEKMRSLEETLKQFMTIFAEQESRLRVVDNELKERAFIADVLESSSKESEIPTGDASAFHGGAVYDSVRKQIISVYQNSNKCRDVFVTHLTDATHGKTEVKKNVIPFETNVRNPIYDGSRFIYFIQAGWDNGTVLSVRRFGRLDLESFIFEELPSLPNQPFKSFAPVFYGCYHHGVVFTCDYDMHLCGYEVEKKSWRRFGIVLPLSGGEPWKHGNLLSDPSDEKHLYLLGSYTNTGIYRIDFDAYTCTLLSSAPRSSFRSYDATLVRPCSDSNTFVVIASMGGNDYHMYSSKTNKWKALPGWKGSGIAQHSRCFLVYAEDTKTFYYHIHGRKTWEVVQL